MSPGFIRRAEADPESAEESASEWGGLIFDRSVEKFVYKRQVKILREMSKETRKISAGIQGNISALTGNIQTWTKEISEDFLAEMNEQIGKLNKKLDQIMNFIQFFDRIHLYPESVSVWNLLNNVIRKNESMNNRVIRREADVSEGLSIQIDPALTRAVLSSSLRSLLNQKTDIFPEIISAQIFCPARVPCNERCLPAAS